MTPRVAVVDDEPRMAEILAMVLGRDGYSVTPFTRPEDALAALEEEPFDLVLTDLKMPGIDGIELLRRARALHPELPVVLITAHGTVSTAIAAMREGAFDYLEKPVDNDACRAVVRRALDMTRLARENRYLRAELRSRYAVADAIAVSPAMEQVFDLARRAAASRASVLVTGESGTGKELVARAIHVHSDRVGRPFVAVNCKALAEGVLDSELFGHDRGAFTGADRARPGLFERADGGTLLLDEIGETTLDFQAKLLRVLQERTLTRVGGDRERTVDVRVVAATNRDLRAEATRGAFREDLYFRLAVIPIHIPPLRERREDVLPLARHFLERINRAEGRAVTGWSDDVERFLLSHSWPGNVRELNTLERGVVLCRTDRLELDDLLVETAPDATPGVAGDGLTLQAYLDRCTADRLRATLTDCAGVRTEAARRLGIDRTTLYRLMRRLGVEEE